MSTKTRQGLRQRLKTYLSDREGSVATIFAVSMIPVLIAAGVGVDVSRAVTARANLQDALDTTVLALAHMPAGTSEADLLTKANAWLNVNLNERQLGTVTLSLTPQQGEILVTASANMPTTLTSIAGINSIPIVARSTARWGLGHVEVALVLDNTGSMAGDKLSRLKTAATGLIDTLSATAPANDPDAVKISVVPFSVTVRVDPTYRNQTWITGSLPAAYGSDIFTVAGTNRFTLLDNMNRTWGGCVESRPAPYDVQDTSPNPATPATMIVPWFAPDEPDDNTVVSGVNRRGNTTYYNYNNDYLSDRINPSGTPDEIWAARQGNQAKYTSAGSGDGPNDRCNMASISRLSTNYAALKTKITNMVATGNTNIPIGMAWGWFTLSPYAPFADGVAYSNADTKKFVVLLTDGDNTMSTTSDQNDSVYEGYGYIWQNRLNNVTTGSTANQRSAAMDSRLTALCTNMKTAGVTIYTVRIDLSGSASTALRNCASSSDKFYDIDSTGLNTAFQNIAGSIGQLRIAQ